MDDAIYEGVDPKEWTRPIEAVIASWADVAACYIWLHDHARRRYRQLHYAYSLPVIILSTVTGTANFGIGSIVPADYAGVAQISIGVTSILIGIVGTLQNFFRFAENGEAHSQAVQGWSKLNRDITYELKIERHFRKNADEFYKQCKADLDRLLESSPLVPNSAIDTFKKVITVVPSVYKPDELKQTIASTYVYDEESFEKNRISLSNAMPACATKSYVSSVIENLVSRKKSSGAPSEQTITAQMNQTTSPRPSNVSKRGAMHRSKVSANLAGDSAAEPAREVGEVGEETPTIVVTAQDK